MKTKKQWEKSDKQLHGFLKRGDEVDESLYNYLGEVVSPAFCNEVATQCGEPYKHDEDGRSYHETMIIDHGKYYYLGILPLFK